jgi:hypothetical protein
MSDVALILVVVAEILALYIAMFIGLYRWSHHAPMFPSDAAVVVTKHIMPRR